MKIRQFRIEAQVLKCRWTSSIFFRLLWSCVLSQFSRGGTFPGWCSARRRAGWKLEFDRPAMRVGRASPGVVGHPCFAVAPPVAERPGIAARMTWNFDLWVNEVRREMVGGKHIPNNVPGEGNYDAGERFSFFQKVLILRSGGRGASPAPGWQDGLVCMDSNSTETKVGCIEPAFRVSPLSSE